MDKGFAARDHRDHRKNNDLEKVVKAQSFLAENVEKHPKWRIYYGHHGYHTTKRC